MNNIVAPVFFVGVLVLVLGGSFFLARWQAKRARENLAALARDLGLQLDEKPAVALGLIPQVPSVRGERGGRSICFHTFTTGSGKHRQTWQAMRLAVANPRGLSFQFGAQNVFTAFGVMLGMQDLQVGDPVFDERFVVKTSAPEFLRAALLPEIRNSLLQHWPARGPGANVKLDGGELVYAEIGSFGDAGVTGRMRAMLEPLFALAALPEVYQGER